MPEVPLDDVAGHAPAVWETNGPWNVDEVLDQALRLVADYYQLLGATLGRATDPPTLAELHQSPLGRDLRLLAGADPTAAPATAVREAAARVKELLLRPLAADEYAVPEWFWATALGRLVARAERASHGPRGLVEPAEAAARLGVAPSSVERWLAEGSLAIVPDDAGRPLVPHDAVERRRAVARELPGEASPPGDVLVAERPLAS